MDLIGRNVDLDLLSLFPQMGARIMEGLRDRASFSSSTMEERESERSTSPRRKKGGIYTPQENRAVWAKTGPDIPAQVGAGLSGGRIIRPQGQNLDKIRPKIRPLSRAAFLPVLRRFRGARIFPKYPARIIRPGYFQNIRPKKTAETPKLKRA